MKFHQIRLLAAAPFLVTTIATSAIADEAVMANSNAVVVTQVATTSVGTDTIVFPMRISVPADGTYVFTSPASNPVTLSLDGVVILTVPAETAEDTEAFRIIMTLTAGDHLIEVEGSNLSAEQVALVSMYKLGTEPLSIAISAEGLTADEAAILAGSISVPLSPMASASTQVASVAPAATPFVIGGNTGAQTDTSTATLGGTTISADGGSPDSAAATSNGAPTTNESGEPITPRRSSGATTVASATPTQTPRTPTSPGISPAPAAVPPTPVVPPVIPDDMARSSPLTPPTGFTLTEAVQITGGASEAGVVAVTGQTLFGRVMDQITYDIVNVVIMPSGRETTVDVGTTTGQFAVRLFPEDLVSGEATVIVTATSSFDEDVVTEPVSYDFTAATPHGGLMQALLRMTNGPSADLYTHVREIGFENYVNEQLNPDAIDDSVFEAMNIDVLGRQSQEFRDNVITRLLTDDIVRSSYSEKQFQDVMGSFWRNHFHTATSYGSPHGSTAWRNVEDRQFYRDNAFGNFEDLLLFSARSPLMAHFLDNRESSAALPGEDRTERINENYGREILELHTVGVDTNYTEEDVIASSLVFTGWSSRQINPTLGFDRSFPAPIHEFIFHPEDHDTEDKFFPFLNTTITGRSGPGGVMEGEELIAILANHPRTRQFVCGKIVQRLVADEMPENFVNSCVDAWAATNGDMGEVFRAILTEPTYTTDVALQQSKFKTPYEYVTSIIRTLDIYPEFDETEPLSYLVWARNALLQSGYDPYDHFVPTGMGEVAEDWMTTAVMMSQYKWATNFTNSSQIVNSGIVQQISDAGVETAEEVAAYMLTVATADRFTREEFEQMVNALNLADRRFDQLINRGRGFKRERDLALRRAAGMLIMLPSFHIQ